MRMLNIDALILNALPGKPKLYLIDKDGCKVTKWMAQVIAPGHPCSVLSIPP